MGAFFTWLMGKSKDELFKMRKARLAKIERLQKQIKEIDVELEKRENE